MGKTQTNLGKALIALMGALLLYACTSFMPVQNAYARTEGIYTYSISSGRATITDCDSKNALGDISIPDTLEGCPVSSIGDYAFSYCDGITGVVIPASVTNIGNGAFVNCKALKNVSIPASVTNIGYSAFSYTNLEDVSIPSSVTSIGREAFGYCSKLVSADISASVKSLGAGVFRSCRKLSNVVIPSSATSIGDYSFQYCSELASVAIPASVEEIGMSAFESCSKLESVDIPSSVRTIDAWAFKSCSSLRKITIPSSVKSIGGEAFQYCTSLENVVIPSSVEKIGSKAFYGCKSLGDITTTWKSAAYDFCKSEGIVCILDPKPTVDLCAIEGISEETYTGKAIAPELTVIYDGKTLEKGVDYSVRYEDNINVGTARVIVEGKGELSGTRELTFPINKDGQAIETDETYMLYDESALAKKARSLRINANSTAGMKITYKFVKYVASGKTTVAKAKKYMSLDEKTGKVTLKKGTPAGTYKMKVRISAAGSSCYEPASITETIKCVVYFKAPKLSKKTLKVTEGFNEKLEVNGGYGLIKWKSSNKKIATVSSKGVVTGKKPGTCTISAIRNGKTLKCKVAVRKNEYNGTKSVSIDSASYGSPELFLNKAYYRGKNLVLDVFVVNNRTFTADSFSWIKFDVRGCYRNDDEPDDNYNLYLGKKKFGKTYIGLGRYAKKKMTFVIPAKKKYDLAKIWLIDMDYDYYYNYTY